MELDKELNKDLKAAIVKVYGWNYPFAFAMGVRESTISAVLRGHKKLSETEKQKWAKTLNVEPGEIFGD